MKAFAIVYLAFFITIFNSVAAQKEDWQEVDQFLNEQKYPINGIKDLAKLAENIIHNFPDSLSRLKAVYAWVSDNISYQTDTQISYKNVASVDSVIKYKMAVCAGYVNIFAQLCNMVGISCKEIEGYGRTGTQPLVNERFSVNHSWAAVWLNTKWNLIDVTWGSGYTIEGTTNFVKKRNDWFFFTESEKFILDHYPKAISWQLLKDTVSWQKFISYAGISLGARESGITKFSPLQSVINASAGEQVLFTFTSRQLLNTILLISKQKSFYKADALEKKNDTYYYNFRVPFSGIYDLQIDLSNVDRSKGGTSTSLIDFVYLINAVDKNTGR